MAIYHLHIKVFSRATGKNAVSSAAYRHATKMFDEQENKNWDYQNKSGVAHKEILTPENSPVWAKELSGNADVDSSSEKLWNLVEKTEKRNDAQLAREAEFALPVELTKEQSILLAREFINDQFVLRGMIADWSLHWDEGNPHVHVMLTMRSLEENGFGLKERAWNNKALLQEWREKWAEYANFHLRLHQHVVRIDHRSYQEQGIDLIPSTHQGKSVTDMDRRGISTDIIKEANDIRRENLKRISHKPEILLRKLTSQYETFTSHHLGHELGRYINDQRNFSHKHQANLSGLSFLNAEKLIEEVHSLGKLTPAVIAQILKTIEHHESVFTEKHLAKAIAPYTNNAESFTKALFQMKASPELLYVGVGNDGRDRFTTRRMFNVENSIQKVAFSIRKSRHVKISDHHTLETLEKYQLQIGKRLTDEQLVAVKHILQPSSISCVVGRAGTGKSFSLGAARAVWEAKGLRVQGVALSGIAADGLSKDAAISSRTIHSFQYALERGQIVLNHHDVIVMDEAGMTDSVSMLGILKAVRGARAKLVLVGDHAQIQPVGPGATFRALLERLGFAEIQTVYRQKEQWQRAATVSFSAGHVPNGLASYAERDCVHFAGDESHAMSRLVEDWFKARALYSKNLDQYLVVAHRNKDVQKLNQLLRMERIQRNEIVEGYSVDSKMGEMKISRGDRLLFLKNDRSLGVNNGRFATISSVEFTESGKATSFTVLLDGTTKEVSINPKEYSEFTHGYAATVHKVQGMTVDHTMVYGNGYFWNRHLTYVAMSRHRETCNLYVNDPDISSLTKRMGRLGMKDSLLDYPIAFAERRGFDITQILKNLPKHLAGHLSQLKERITEKFKAYAGLKHPEKVLVAHINANLKEQFSLEDILAQYIGMELEQTDLVNETRITKQKDSKAGALLSAHLLIKNTELNMFAKEVMENPNIKIYLEKLKNAKPISLAQRGGFIAMKDRLRKGELTQEDYLSLVAKLKNTAHDRSQTTSRDKDRGGRSR